MARDSLAAAGEGTAPRVDQLCRGQDGMTSSERINLEPSVVLLHAYLDGELSVSESAEAERKIAANDGLAAEAAAVRALKRALRTQLPPEKLPPDFSSRIARRIGLSRPRCRPTWMLLAASVMLSIGLSSAVTSFVLRGGDDRIYAESVDSHLRALMAARPVDVASSERHTVKPWFNGRSVQAPKVADLAPQGFPLLGGRIDVIRSAPVPTLIYTRRLHTISVWAANDAQGALLTKSATSVNGTNLVVWRAGDLTYWAASDLNPAELTIFAQSFADAP
jgi:anti-sigma factor RsiW